MKRAIVVGSGLAGLTAAYRLHERGWRVTVLESRGRAGGRVLSEMQDGFLCDVGPTIVTDTYSECFKLVDDVGLANEVVDCPTEMGLVRDGQLHLLDTAKPIGSFLTTKLLSPKAKLRLVLNGPRMIRPLFRMDPYELRNRLQYDNQSITSYINRVFGRELNHTSLKD